MQSDDAQLVGQVEEVVHQRMSGQGAGHDIDHVLRVTHTAKKLQDLVGGNRLVVELAALLHDIGDAKFHDGVERSAEFASEILSQHEAPPEVISHVCDIVDRISFRKGIDSDTLSLEGKIVQDADRLDAIGAIGIVRTVEYGAVKGQPFYSSNPQISKTGIAHFDDKLFKLTALMNTDPARRIAEERERFMRSFVDQFKLECEFHDEEP